MKIGIITYHNASNYGAVLQTYALQEIIKEIIGDVEIINYDNRFIKKGLDVVRFDPSLLGIYYCLHDILNHRTRKVKIRRFKDFFIQNYLLSASVNKTQILSGTLKYDVGVSGSDQIWNPILRGTCDEVYFLAFPGIVKKISYASSFGSYHFDNDEENKKIAEYLKDYSFISIRDNPERLSKLIDREIRSDCDPTLLLTKEEWVEKLDIVPEDEAYILVYCMTNQNDIIKFSKRVGEKLGLKIKVIGDSFNRTPNIQVLNDLGPAEFVSAFYNASYIITNSFHGTAFASNFAKPFLSIRNESSPERAETYLKSISADKRLTRIIDGNIDKCLALLLDEETYLPQIDSLRCDGINYLRASLRQNK